MDVDKINLLSGLKLTELTAALCPSKIFNNFPVFASHIRKVLSLDAVTINLPFGLNLAEYIEL